MAPYYKTPGARVYFEGKSATIIIPGLLQFDDEDNNGWLVEEIEVDHYGIPREHLGKRGFYWVPSIGRYFKKNKNEKEVPEPYEIDV